MYTTTLLISEANIRSFTDINKSVDSEFLNNAIRVSGDYYLQNTLGTKLYRKIIDLVNTNSIADPYKKLLEDYCQDYLLYCAYYETLEALYIRPRNNGLLRSTGGENSESADFEMFNIKRQSVKNKMDFYNTKLTQYLIEEEVLFPELNQNNKLYENYPDYSEKYRNPFVTSRMGFAEEAKSRGIKIYDSRYKQFPQ